MTLRGKHLNSGIRGGLWEDQYLQRMGPAVWLFGWLVHRQTRERHGVGLVLAGSPLTYEMISADTGMAVRTLKRWMARLAGGGYVRVQHTLHKRMVIQIARPRSSARSNWDFHRKGSVFHRLPFLRPDQKGHFQHLRPCQKGQSWHQRTRPQRRNLLQTHPLVPLSRPRIDSINLRENKQSRAPSAFTPFLTGQTEEPSARWKCAPSCALAPARRFIANDRTA